MHDRLQLLKRDLNARAEVLSTDAGADFSDLGLNGGSLGGLFQGDFSDSGPPPCVVTSPAADLSL